MHVVHLMAYIALLRDIAMFAGFASPKTGKARKHIHVKRRR